MCSGGKGHLLVEALRVGVRHDNVPEPGEHLGLLCLHHYRRIHSCRGGNSQAWRRRRASVAAAAELCYSPWTVMSAMLRRSSHTSTWKESSTAFSLRLNTPPSLLALDAAHSGNHRHQRTWLHRPHPHTPMSSAPIRPGPAFSACLLASGFRPVGTSEGTMLVRKLMVDRRALVCSRKSSEENSTWKIVAHCATVRPLVSSPGTADAKSIISA